MKDAVVEAAALLDWNDASFARNVEDERNLIKGRILGFSDRHATIRSRKSINRTALLKWKHKRARQMKHLAYQEYSQNLNQFTRIVY